ncbi:hypothetical protein WJX72_010238 [[Myrmecia] bisecta]|uniref:Uncharacterized protein n=1 Tax=[Myrmecia] bisecta TaxID=41462 RepID=A0AAW1Q4Q9_9CHLO
MGQAIVNFTLAEAAGVPLPATPTLPAQVDTPGAATGSKDSRYFTTFYTATEQPYTMTARSTACKAFRADTLGPDTAPVVQHQAAAPSLRTQPSQRCSNIHAP